MTDLEMIEEAISRAYQEMRNASYDHSPITAFRIVLREIAELKKQTTPEEQPKE